MFKYIDLFAGIGGLRIPFQEQGGKCVFTSEWDKYAQQTYEANYNEKPNGDITQIKEEDIENFDILLGGFPCQAFSIAGKRMGFEDTRGTLFFDVARIIKFHKPKAFLLENVKGLLSHNKKQTFKVICNTLQELGYNIHYKILNAKHFGLPQNRERIYIIGFLDDVDFEFPEPPMTKTKLGDILDEKVDEKYTISDRLWASHQERKRRNKEKGWGFGYSLFNHESEYTSTISARYYKDGSEVLIAQENKNPRKLTPREASRLQGFPKNFNIPVSDTQAYKQFGNSVAVSVIREIAKEMLISLKILENESRRNKPRNKQIKIKY
ncbi:MULTISPECIES: DNA cytosine methyltransferase [Tenacibaculum]|uniref:DNA cytosine methyltransferase n=1 Tax=Tenacibaculum TaxID=104267 RepID=UPI001BEAB2B9|nr:MULTISPECIES: DNA cytosine methyltransferase [Tenacibaculum]MCG8786401.1 DNA cytosine methyltransferase [Tenacibaculum finnmarkense]